MCCFVFDLLDALIHSINVLHRKSISFCYGLYYLPFCVFVVGI